jgi:hypothetical protein
VWDSIRWHGTDLPPSGPPGPWREARAPTRPVSFSRGPRVAALDGYRKRVGTQCITPIPSFTYAKANEQLNPTSPRAPKLQQNPLRAAVPNRGLDAAPPRQSARKRSGHRTRRLSRRASLASRGGPRLSRKASPLAEGLASRGGPRLSRKASPLAEGLASRGGPRLSRRASPLAEGLAFRGEPRLSRRASPLAEGLASRGGPRPLAEGLASRGGPRLSRRAPPLAERHASHGGPRLSRRASPLAEGLASRGGPRLSRKASPLAEGRASRGTQH